MEQELYHKNKIVLHDEILLDTILFVYSIHNYNNKCANLIIIL